MHHDYIQTRRVQSLEVAPHQQEQNGSLGGWLRSCAGEAQAQEKAQIATVNFDRFAGAAAAACFVSILLITVWLGLWGPTDSLTWSNAGEIIKVLGSIATGGAAITGAIVAWRGLEKWRSETIGKSRYEVAVAALADFYEMDEIIRASRNPFILAQEMAPMEGVSDEKPQPPPLRLSAA